MGIRLVGYDLKNGIERLDSQRPDAIGLPILHWVEPRLVIAWEWGQNGAKSPPVNEPDAADTLQFVQTACNAAAEALPPGPGIP